jgi:hypothetical protein
MKLTRVTFPDLAVEGSLARLQTKMSKRMLLSKPKAYNYDFVSHISCFSFVIAQY